MNELLKLGVAFATGVVVTYLFIGFVNEAHAPTNAPFGTGSIAPSADEESTSTNETLGDNDESASAAPSTQTQTQTQQNYTPPPAEPQYPRAALVSYTGTRFLEDEVVIVTGGSVTWRNDSDDRDMRIVTNFHPYHEGYPEKSENGCSPTTFDQCASVGPGGTWTFTFNEEGRWHYHNEEKPDVTGMVRVLSREDYDKEF